MLHSQRFVVRFAYFARGMLPALCDSHTSDGGFIEILLRVLVAIDIIPDMHL